MITSPWMGSFAVQMEYDLHLLHKQGVAALKDFMVKLYGCFDVRWHSGECGMGKKAFLCPQ